MEVKKFLDINGLNYLWSKISLEDYPNNKILAAVIEAIDKEKANRTELEAYLKKEDYIAGETGGAVIASMLIEMVYPVGSIYMSMNNTSPNILFGFGEWEQIEDRFLLAAGPTYSAGTTGGEAEHTLTELEMPAHDHEFDRHQLWKNEQVPPSTTTQGDGYGVSNKTLPIYTDSTIATGAGEAHNNMPPYLTVYMWKRIN